MGSRDEARPPSKGREDPEPGADLPPLLTNKGAPDVGLSLKDEVMKITPVQCRRPRRSRRQVQQRGRHRYTWRDHIGQAVGDPVRRGYWGNKIGKPHTVPCKVTGKCGSVTVRMVPVPGGAGIVAAWVPKKVLQFAGIEDVFTSSRGSTKTLGNFVKATYDRLLKAYGFLTPDFWKETRFSKSPFQEYTDLLALGRPTKPLVIEDNAEQIET